MYENIVTITGQFPGPTSIILAGVHGNETCGPQAFDLLLPTLKLDSGTVIFAYGNPKAIESSQRFVESNLNRMFKPNNQLSDTDLSSYEYSRAQVIKQYLDLADALLDIHASFTPKSRPFLICEPNSRKVTQYLPFDLVVSGFDTFEPGGTDYYMNQKGSLGICAECGYLSDPKSTDIAIASISAFLKACGHLSNDLGTRSQSHLKIYQLYLTKTSSFKLNQPFSDFQCLKKGQIIGLDGNCPVLAPIDSQILFARNRQAVGEEAFLLGKEI